MARVLEAAYIDNERLIHGWEGRSIPSFGLNFVTFWTSAMCNKVALKTDMQYSKKPQLGGTSHPMQGRNCGKAVCKANQHRETSVCPCRNLEDNASSLSILSFPLLLAQRASSCFRVSLPHICVDKSIVGFSSEVTNRRLDQTQRQQAWAARLELTPGSIPSSTWPKLSASS